MQIIFSYLKKFLVYFFGIWLLYAIPAYIQYGCYWLGFEGPFRTGYMGNMGFCIEVAAVAIVGIFCCWVKHRQEWQLHLNIFSRRQPEYIGELLIHLVMLGLALVISATYPLFIVPVVPYLDGQPLAEYFYLNNIGQLPFYITFSAAYLISRHLFDSGSLAENNGQTEQTVRRLDEIFGSGNKGGNGNGDRAR